jgi:hypothetical protein
VRRSGTSVRTGSERVSGLLEIFGAIAALGYWYMFEMTRRIGQIMDMAHSGKLGPGLDEHQIRGAALALFYMSPGPGFCFIFLRRVR